MDHEGHEGGGEICGKHLAKLGNRWGVSQESGVRSREVRSRESGVGSQEAGVRSRESGVGSRESGVRRRGSGIGGQES